MAFLMGIDLGTSSVRAGIYSDDGVCLGISSRSYGFETPEPGRAEQNPDVWWSSTCACIRETLEKAGIAGGGIDGISFSGQMHGTVTLDSYDRPAAPAVIWADTRSEAECAELTGLLGETRLRSIVMNRMFPGTQAATLRWMMTHDSGAWKRTRRILTPKDYLRYRMCGLFNTEPSDASATLLFDTGKREWSDEILKMLSIPVEFLPYVVNSDQYIAETENIEDETGLPDGIPVILGGGDQPCAALGCGILDEGSLLVTIGTGGQIFAPASSPSASPGLALNTFCHVHHSRWYTMGATMSAGLSLRWYRDTFATGTDYDILGAEAAESPPGARGLTFVPYLAGKRSPELNPSAAGSFSGIDLGHGRGHYVRAVMEGVVFDLRENLDVMRGMGIAPERVVLSGGGAKSGTWSKIVADVFGIPVEIPSGGEQACYGAALLAGTGAGVYASLHEAAGIAKPSAATVEPDNANAAVYAESYERYMKASNES